jgi:hypothetical protein
MLETKTNATKVVEENSRITKPYVRKDFLEAPEQTTAKFDVVKISNDIIFIGLSSLAIYLFYTILTSLML